MDIGYLETPIGLLQISADMIGITEVKFIDQKDQEPEQNHPLIKQAQKELQEYFERRRKSFQVPLHIVKGTDFQRLCWDALLKIPYGETRSYYEQACFINRPKALRAVGGANHHNPIAIIIPCHRIIAKNGSLCGYGGRIMRKDYLLRLEAGDEE